MALIKCLEVQILVAPMGTPIMASGDGVVKKVGWCGGGGNCVVNITLHTKQYSICRNLLEGLNRSKS